MGKHFPAAARRVGRGVCRFCGCSEYDACGSGCAWADRTDTLCSECIAPAEAERLALMIFRYYVGARFTAFHRGFVVGWFRLRSASARNPYQRSSLAYAWNRGHEQGRQARRSHGPVLNAPRPFVYQLPGSSSRKAATV